MLLIGVPGQSVILLFLHFFPFFSFYGIFTGRLVVGRLLMLLLRKGRRAGEREGGRWNRNKKVKRR